MTNSTIQIAKRLLGAGIDPKSVTDTSVAIVMQTIVDLNTGGPVPADVDQRLERLVQDPAFQAIQDSNSRASAQRLEMDLGDDNNSSRRSTHTRNLTKGFTPP